MIFIYRYVLLLITQGPDFSELAIDVSFLDSFNGTSDGYYRTKFEDSVNPTECMEGLDISEWPWLNDTFASSKDGSLPVPLQETSFSSQSDSEPSTGPPTGLSTRNEFLGIDNIEADIIEVNGKKTFIQSQPLQQPSSFESPAPIPIGQKHRKTGRRTGPLSLEMKQKVASIRSLKACWLCWLSKIPVSGGNYLL